MHLFIFIFILATLFLPQKALALEKIFTPSFDTYIKPPPSESHGFEPTLLLEYNKQDPDFSYNSYVFIQFDLLSLPKDAVIDSATMTLTLISVSSMNRIGCDAHLYRQGGPWDEHDHYTSLGFNSTLKIYDIVFLNKVGKYNWDITELMTS